MLEVVLVLQVVQIALILYFFVLAPEEDED